MTPEQRLTAEIKLFCGQRNAICVHTNVGQAWTGTRVKLVGGGTVLKDIRPFSTGLPVGWPDLMIVHPKGLVFYCETKTHPRKPTKEQRETIAVLRSKNIVAGVAYTLEEFITLWEEAEKKVIIF